ncbi:MAG: hypothetical protein KJ573_02080 [Proteobacteria bacterium]|nr:hypothetical protein [Pseudomonadota bacterium]MBU0988614.1 hypothetical protein [Pseudomonadota bacterium]MBU1902362.1 hypothetical protein [Pseudomonadota bacterium]
MEPTEQTEDPTLLIWQEKDSFGSLEVVFLEGRFLDVGAWFFVGRE